MKTFKQEVKLFYKRTRKELIEMEKYWEGKSESWHDSVAGDNYDVKIGIVRELLESLETTVIDLGIIIKQNHGTL